MSSGAARGTASHLRITLAATAVLGGAGFVSGVLTNRLLGPTGRGELAAVQVAPALLATVGALGMAEALVYRATLERERGRPQAFGAIAIALIGSVVAVGVGWFALPVILGAQTSDTLHIARTYLFGLPLLVMVLVVPSTLRASGDFLPWNVFRIAPALLWTLVVVLASLTGRDSVRFLAYGHLVLLFLLMIPMVVVSVRRAAGSGAPRRDEIRGLVAFGAPTAGQTLPYLLNLRLDQFVISATLAATQLGLYAAAVNWVVAITLVMEAVGFVLFPSLAAIADEEARLRRFAQSARLGVAAALLLGLAVASLTPFFLTKVLGESFRAAIPAAFLLCAANSVLGFARVLGDGARGLGAPSVAFIAELWGLVVMTAALVVFLGPMGIEGAALASLLAYTTIVVSVIIQVHRRYGMSVSSLLAVDPREVYEAFHAVRPRFPASLSAATSDTLTFDPHAIGPDIEE